MKIKLPDLKTMAGNLLELLEEEDIRFIGNPAFLHTRTYKNWKEQGADIDFGILPGNFGTSTCCIIYSLPEIGCVLAPSANMGLGYNQMLFKYHKKLPEYQIIPFKQDEYGNFINTRMKGGMHGMKWILEELKTLSILESDNMFL